MTKEQKPAPEPDLMTVDLTKIKSPVLRRLVEEVKYERAARMWGGYDRTHNRHNRS